MHRGEIRNRRGERGRGREGEVNTTSSSPPFLHLLLLFLITTTDSTDMVLVVEETFRGRNDRIGLKVVLETTLETGGKGYRV